MTHEATEKDVSLRTRKGPLELKVPFWLKGKGLGLVLICGLGSAGLATGCSGSDGRLPVHEVKGQVKVGGEVPEGALIVFYPSKPEGAEEVRPSAKVRSDGSFKLTTYDADDGAPAGEYVGTIQWNKLIKKGSDSVAGPNVVPKEYQSRDTSLWRITVGDGPVELDPKEITESATK